MAGGDVNVWSLELLAPLETDGEKQLGSEDIPCLRKARSENRTLKSCWFIELYTNVQIFFFPINLISHC